MEFRRQQLPGMEQRANTKMPGRLRDQLDIFQNKIISATETGFSSRFFHMLKFLSPSSLAAAVQGTQLYRATGSTFAYLWQKADEKSCELTNHNPSVIKHLENRAWHGEMKKQEQSSLLQALQQSGISYRKSNYKQIPSVVELSPRLSAPFSSSLTICSSGTSFYWPNLCPVVYCWVADSQGRRFKIYRGKRRSGGSLGNGYITKWIQTTLLRIIIIITGFYQD